MKFLELFGQWKHPLPTGLCGRGQRDVAPQKLLTREMRNRNKEIVANLKQEVWSDVGG